MNKQLIQSLALFLIIPAIVGCGRTKQAEEVRIQMGVKQIAIDKG